MKAREFVGLIPPLLSSFTQDGEIYEKGIREIIRFTLPHVNAYYPNGTYGCGPLMTNTERKKVLEIILDEVNGRIPVIAHVGAAGTQPMLDLAKHAKAAGANAVGAISPYYSPKLPDESLYKHFAGLIDAVNEDDFPVFVYHNAHYSQNTVTPALLKRLADYGLRGCKDSSFDLVNFFLFQDAVADYPDFNLIVGTEAIFIGAFDAGAIGTVCGMGNIFPETMATLYKAYVGGDREKALEVQRLVLRIRAVTKLGQTVPIMHEILKMRGVDAGYPRSPLIEIDPGLRNKVAEALKALHLL
jgi:dihydrodipicolinate synthase/N-acetylneuraminate lyase